MFRQYLLHAPSKCDSSTLGLASQEAVKSMYKDIKDIGSLQVYPSRVHHPTSFLVSQANAHTHPLFLVSVLVLLMYRPLASPLCCMWQVGNVTAVLMPDQVWPKSQHTQTHSSAITTQGLHSRAQTKEVKALCPLSLPNFKCHAQLNRAAWVTAGLLCEDVSSF